MLVGGSGWQERETIGDPISRGRAQRRACMLQCNIVVCRCHVKGGPTKENSRFSRLVGSAQLGATSQKEQKAVLGSWELGVERMEIPSRSPGFPRAFDRRSVKRSVKLTRGHHLR